MKRNHKWLTIYLQDHYAGATAGSRLFRRVAGSHSDPRVRQVVGALAAQVEKDQRSLAKIMRSLKIRHSRPKEGLAWGAEKLGRLKPNGTVLRRSPLTDVVELEGLSLASSSWTGRQPRRLVSRSCVLLAQTRSSPAMGRRVEDVRRLRKIKKLDSTRLVGTREVVPTSRGWPPWATVLASPDGRREPVP
jgi:hypothetical protein